MCLHYIIGKIPEYVHKSKNKLIKCISKDNISLYTKITLNKYKLTIQMYKVQLFVYDYVIERGSICFFLFVYIFPSCQ